MGHWRLGFDFFPFQQFIADCISRVRYKPIAWITTCLFQIWVTVAFKNTNSRHSPARQEQRRKANMRIAFDVKRNVQTQETAGFVFLLPLIDFDASFPRVLNFNYLFHVD